MTFALFSYSAPLLLIKIEKKKQFRIYWFDSDFLVNLKVPSLEYFKLKSFLLSPAPCLKRLTNPPIVRFSNHSRLNKELLMNFVHQLKIAYNISWCMKRNRSRVDPEIPKFMWCYRFCPRVKLLFYDTSKKKRKKKANWFHPTLCVCVPTCARVVLQECHKFLICFAHY